MKTTAIPLMAATALIASAAIAEAQQFWSEVDSADFSFQQVSLETKPLKDGAGNLAVQVSAVLRITNDTTDALEGVRWVWPWGIGYHLYSGQADQIFERRWNEKLGQFVFDGQDAWYDGNAGVSLTPVGLDGLMAFSDTDLSPFADAEDYDWLGVDQGAVLASEYPILWVDPASQVPYYDLGTIAAGASVEFSYGAWLEYPNDPVPNQIGFYGLPGLVQQVPESSVWVLVLGGAVLLVRRRR